MVAQDERSHTVPKTRLLIPCGICSSSSSSSSLSSSSPTSMLPPYGENEVLIYVPVPVNPPPVNPPINPPVNPPMSPPRQFHHHHQHQQQQQQQQLSPSQSMEIVWHGEFERLFSQYTPNQWFLMPTPTPPGDRWRVFKDSAKVRFSCQECGHGWTSMKGRVIFWFNLNYTTNSGWVMFKLYGQQCQKCKNGKYEHAMWYPEEVVKVVGNVYNRVGQIFYGFVRPPLRIDRRQGKPRNQHNTDLCQACKDGLCKEEWSFS